MTQEKQPDPNEAQTFKSAVRKLMQVPQHELKEKIEEEKRIKQGDRGSEVKPDESDRRSCSVR